MIYIYIYIKSLKKQPIEGTRTKIYDGIKGLKLDCSIRQCGPSFVRF